MIKQVLYEKGLLVEQYIDNHLPKETEKPSIIFKAMRYSIFAGGKRIRPILSLLVNDMIGGDEYKLLPCACAIELIHTYSLIHDDLPSIDNDDYRRGKFTCHKRFGEATAVLAGDALLTLAFQWISFTDQRPKVIVDIIRELAVASGIRGMIAGQVADLEAEGLLKKNSLDKPNIEEELKYIHTNKTAALIRASVVVGAYSAGAEEDDVKICRIFGSLIGLAFQIADDILDIEGDIEGLGKAVGKDHEHNKLTYPALYGLDSSKEKAKELILEAKDVISSFDNSLLLSQLADLIINRAN